MVAADGASVAELNLLARAGRVAAGTVERYGVALAGGAVAGVGDLVVTRRNDRSLVTGRGFVKNGDRFVVTATGKDATLTLRRLGGSGEVVLPAAYVAEHVELGYATSCHRAQGQTVDTAHVLVSPAISRELLYVAATRGREENRLYVETAFDPDPETGHAALTPRQAAREVLRDVLRNAGAEVSAHEALAAAGRQSEDLVGLAAEYETLAQAAAAPRVVAMLGARRARAGRARPRRAQPGVRAARRLPAGGGGPRPRRRTSAAAPRRQEGLRRRRRRRGCRPRPGRAVGGGRPPGAAGGRLCRRGRGAHGRRR